MLDDPGRRWKQKKGACKVTSALVQLNSSDTSGITSFSTSASIEARTIFITVNPEMSSGDAGGDVVAALIGRLIGLRIMAGAVRGSAFFPELFPIPETR